MFSALARASAITVAQALLLVGLLHLSLGVSWSALPATLGFSILTALAFTAFHYLLTIGLGKAGLVVSLFVLAVQVTSTGGLYPIQLLAAPFQWISPLLPLTYGVQGMQGIIAGGDRRCRGRGGGHAARLRGRQRPRGAARHPSHEAHAGSPARRARIGPVAGVVPGEG